MKTVKDVFAEFKHALGNLYEASEVEALTLLAISEFTGLSKAKIKAFPESELYTQQSDKLTETLVRLKTGEPIQYILGATEFYGLAFKVNPGVLIPRPETEELVDWVISSVGSSQLAVGSILDIGTGSGCIAISLKKNLPNCKVSAIDISADALKTAKENAALSKVDVEFVQSDILNLKSFPPSQISHRKSHISLVISNPPYVTLHDKTQMHTNVTDFEPHTALFVPEDDPLIFYKAIADFAANHLSENGLLFFEINESYGKEIVELLASKGFTGIELKQDMSGKNRMVMASLSSSY